MPHPRQHRRISKVAYTLIKKELTGIHFPKYENIQKHEGFFNVDSMTLYRILYRYAIHNHMNSKKYKGSLIKSIKYYNELVSSLQDKKPSVGKNAALLSHFIVDSLDPAHLKSWRTRRSFSFNTLYIHLWLEKESSKVKMSKVTSFEEFNIKLSDYIIKESQKILKLNIYKLYPKNKGKILSLYKNYIIPLQVKSVALFWYKAANQANMD